jgi:hypothetical protein
MIPQLASLAYNDGFEMPGDGGGAPDYSSAMGNVRFQAIPVNQGMMALMAAANNANAEVEPVMPPSSNPINIGPLAQNPLVSMAVNSILQSFFQSSGFNIGQFLPQYSYSRQVKSFALSRRIAATAAAVSPLDKTSIAASLSKPFRAIAPGMSQDTIDNIAGYLASPTGMMVAKTGAQMLLGQERGEDFLSELFGSNFAAQLFAEKVALQSERLFDPVTGLRGYSPETASTLISGLSEDLRTRPERYAYLTPTRVSRLYQEMAKGGYLPQSISQLRSIREQNIELAKDEIMSTGGGSDPLSQEDLISKINDVVGNIEKLSAPERAQKLRKFDARKAADSLASMAKSISAMDALFADSGIHGAPMATLLQSVEILTGKSSRWLGDAKTAQLIQELQVTGELSGINVGRMAGMIAQNNDVLRKGKYFGAIGAEIAGRGSIFETVFRDNEAAYVSKAYGSIDQRTANLLDQRLLVSAATTPAAHRLGAIRRFIDSGTIRPGTPAEEFYRSVVAGGKDKVQLTGTNNQTKTFNSVLSDSELKSLLEFSGIDPATVGLIMQSSVPSEFTAEAVEQGGLHEVIRRGMAPEYRERLVQGVSGIIAGLASGKTGASQQELQKVVADTVSDFISMPSARRADKIQFLKESLDTRLNQARLSPDEKQAVRSMVPTLAPAMLARMAVVTDTDTNFDNLESALTALSPSMNDSIVRETTRTKTEALKRRALNTFNRESPVERVGNMMLDPESSFIGNLAKFLGNIPTQEVVDRLNETSPDFLPQGAQKPAFQMMKITDEARKTSSSTREGLNFLYTSGLYYDFPAEAMALEYDAGIKLQAADALQTVNPVAVQQTINSIFERGKKRTSGMTDIEKGAIDQLSIFEDLLNQVSSRWDLMGPPGANEIIRSMGGLGDNGAWISPTNPIPAETDLGGSSNNQSAVGQGFDPSGDLLAILKSFVGKIGMSGVTVNGELKLSETGSAKLTGRMGAS